MITIQTQRTGLLHAKTKIFNLNNRDYYLMRLPTLLIICNVMFFFVCASHETVKVKTCAMRFCGSGRYPKLTSDATQRFSFTTMSSYITVCTLWLTHRAGVPSETLLMENWPSVPFYFNCLICRVIMSIQCRREILAVRRGRPNCMYGTDSTYMILSIK